MFLEVGLKREIKNIKNLQQQYDKIKTLIHNIKMNKEIVVEILLKMTSYVYKFRILVCEFSEILLK